MAVITECAYVATIRFCKPDGKGGVNTIAKHATEPLTMLEAVAWVYHSLEQTGPELRDAISFVSIRQERVAT